MWALSHGLPARPLLLPDSEKQPTVAGEGGSAVGS